MKYKAILAMLCTLCSSCKGVFDEAHIAIIVQKALSLSGDVVAEKLRGGLAAQVFLVHNDDKKYIVKLMNEMTRTDRERAIYNYSVAMEKGCGPIVYFGDPEQGILILEYLPRALNACQDLHSEQGYGALAELLKKIHQGKAFKDGGFDVFKLIASTLPDDMRYCDLIPMDRIEQLITIIHKALLPQLTAVSSHNDLNPTNLIFLKNEWKVIDYDDSGIGDPYLDIATIAVSCDFVTQQNSDTILLKKYLNREPSPVEAAKLYLMKQVVMIAWACFMLTIITPEDVSQYQSVQSTKIKHLFTGLIEGCLDLHSSENKLIFVKASLERVLENAQSPEFKQAITILLQKS